ncbi:MAG TPA: hypothetical protein VFQ70_01330 [Candidatus Saccharimonadaceae bacterium]|nr:hypothetical protein [Candidatus Saccharimonadaceae bacterium]
MDIQPKSDQSISDDQELAKVLAGVSAQADDSAAAAADDTVVTTPAAPTLADDTTAASTVSQLPTPEVVPTPDPVTSSAPVAPNGDLDTIKQQALGELRPLVDKLDVAPDEKFDTYLLLLRSTDDTSLIGPAHEAAKNIPDETRRAQALLDIIKEIDFFNQPQQ